MIREISDPARMVEQAILLKRKRFKPGFDGMDGQAAYMWVEINGKRLSAVLCLRKEAVAHP